MTIDITGTDSEFPEISYAEIYGYPGTPVEVLPGQEHWLTMHSSDDYALENIEIDWKVQGDPTWNSINVSEQPDGSCRINELTNTTWLVPSDLEENLILDVRFSAFDKAGNVDQETIQVKTRLNAEPSVTFVSPVGGETYLKSTVEQPECIPVEFYFQEGAEIIQIDIGWTTGDHTQTIEKSKFYSIPEDGHLDTCIPTTETGDELEIYVRISDENYNVFFFYAPIVTVNFESQKPPWGPIILEQTQFELPLPIYDNPSSNVKYYSLEVNGEIATLIRDDERSWRQASPYYTEVGFKQLFFDTDDMSLINEIVILPASVEEDPTNPSANHRWLRPFRYTDNIIMTYLETVGSSDYDFYARTIFNGAVTPPVLLGTYLDRSFSEEPSTWDYIETPLGANLLSVKHGIDSVYQTDLYRYINNSWSFIGNINPRIESIFVCNNKTWGISKDSSSGTDTVFESYEINELTAEQSNQIAFLTFPFNNPFYKIRKDIHSDSVYLFVFDYQNWNYNVSRFDGNQWTILMDSTFPTTWRNTSISALYAREFMAASGRLSFFMQITDSANDSYDALITASENDTSINLENAITSINFNVDTYSEGQITMDENGNLLKIVNYCEWNFEDRLCFQKGYAGESDCFDGDPCTEDIWDQETGTCVFEPVVCENDPNDLCATPQVCDNQTGQCVEDPLQAIECDDGLYCNGEEVCDPSTGDCITIPVPDLDDEISCTQDICDEQTQSVQHVLDDYACITDHCHTAYCDPAFPESDPVTGCYEEEDPIISDGLDCTTDGCDPLTGDPTYALIAGSCLIQSTCISEGTINPSNICQACETAQNSYDWSPYNEGQPCGDGLWCNGTEACISGTCQTGSPPCQDDAIYCNGTESCNEISDLCLHSGDPCTDDGLFCNGVESCDEGQDTCVSSSEPCPVDELWCNGTESCDESNDICEVTGIPDCDDGIPCSDDFCDDANDQCDSTDNCSILFVNPVCPGNAMPEDSVIVSVEIDQADGVDLLGFDLSYDNTTLLYTGFTVAGCLMEPWPSFDCLESDGIISCDGGPESPLPVSSEGCLLDLHFDVYPGTLGVVTNLTITDLLDDLELMSTTPCSFHIGECTENSECDDSNFCNGQEECIDNACISGEIACPSDENDCTDDFCNEIEETCDYLCNATDFSDSCCQDLVCSSDPICVPPPCNDIDEDGYGNPASTLCLFPEWDCDDTDPVINSTNAEGPSGDLTCSDGIDNDCDLNQDGTDLSCINTVKRHFLIDGALELWNWTASGNTSIGQPVTASTIPLEMADPAKLTWFDASGTELFSYRNYRPDEYQLLNDWKAATASKLVAFNVTGKAASLGDAFYWGEQAEVHGITAPIKIGGDAIDPQYDNLGTNWFAQASFREELQKESPVWWCESQADAIPKEQTGSFEGVFTYIINNSVFNPDGTLTLWVAGFITNDLDGFQAGTAEYGIIEAAVKINALADDDQDGHYATPGGDDCDDDPLDDPTICDTCSCGQEVCAGCARCIYPGAVEVSGDTYDTNCNGQPDCFIATVSMGTQMAGKIESLRAFRDFHLRKTKLGRDLVDAYYQHSPKFARFIERHQMIKKLVRTLLLPVVGATWLITPDRDISVNAEMSFVIPEVFSGQSHEALSGNRGDTGITQQDQTLPVDLSGTGSSWGTSKFVAAPSL